MIGLGVRIGNAIRGLVNALTPGWDLYVADNTGAPLNTANELDFVLGGTLTFDDLTGVTITETIGTGTFAIVGNTVECTSAGTLQKLTLSNGLVYRFTEGIGNSVYSATTGYTSMLLLGQSNAISDNTSADGYPADLSTSYPNSIDYDTLGASSPMAYNVNAYTATGAGFGVEFRITKHLQDLGRNTAWIKYALGGTSVGLNGGGWWHPTTGTGTVGFLSTAVNSGVKSEFLVWIQGERDSKNLDDANNYQTNLTNLFAEFRAAINPNLKIIIVSLFDFPDPTLLYKSTVQAAQDAIAAADDLVWVLNPATDAGVTLADIKPDNIHYDVNGIDKIGVAITTLMDSIGYYGNAETERALITNATWSQGISNAISIETQTSLINRNSYLWFDGTTKVANDAVDLTNKKLIAKFILGSTASNQIIYQNSVDTAKRLAIAYNTNGYIGASMNGNDFVEKDYSILASSIGIAAGSLVTIEIDVNDYKSPTVTINGNLSNSSSNVTNATSPGMTFGTSSANINYFTGAFIYVDVDGVIYSPFNSFQNGTYSGNIKHITFGQISDIINNDYDVVDMPIFQDVSPYGYNFSGQNTHHFATGQIVDTTSDSSWGFWAQLIEKGVEQIIFSNDTTEVKFTTSGALSWTFNGGTLVGDTTFSNGDKIYFGLYSNGLVGEIYFGDENTSMIQDTTTGAIGIGVASTTEVVLGNATGKAINGKLEQINHHPLAYTVVEFENDRLATISKI